LIFFFFVAWRALFSWSFVRCPSLTHCRQLHRRRRLHCVVVIFGPSSSFENTGSRRLVCLMEQGVGLPWLFFLLILCCCFVVKFVVKERSLIAFFVVRVLIVCFLRCDLCRHHHHLQLVYAFCFFLAMRTLLSSWTVHIVAAGKWRMQYWCWCWFLLRGARCFHDLLCAARPSHIADNCIGEAGCIVVSSSLVHLPHLDQLHLSSKFVWWSRVLVCRGCFCLWFCVFVLWWNLLWRRVLFCNYFMFHVCFLRCELCHHHEQHTATTMHHRCRLMTHAMLLLIIFFVAWRALFSWSFVRCPSLTHCR
jgi:hypothetical protein